ncbi:hypothetical protein C8Q76DRAFT_802038 [Earliella scabrosa]|nr:hypothetical protein C8Q76DRAFT_802038 [Earliella scabrosa]
MPPLPIFKPLAAISMASIPEPTSSPHMNWIGLAAVAAVAIGFSTVVVLIYRNHRQLQAQLRLAHKLDLESQAQVATITSGRHLFNLPQCGTGGRQSSGLSAAEITAGSAKAAGELPLPAAHVRISASSRLRDSVLCKAIGQLPLPDAGKLKRTMLGPVTRKTADKSSKEVEDIEAIAGLTKATNEVSPDSTLSYPEWVRPRLPAIREQAKKEWNIYVPATGLLATSSAPTTAPAMAIPKIVVIPPRPEDDLLGLPAEESLASIYSEDSLDGAYEEVFHSFDEDSESEYSASSIPMDTPSLDMDRESQASSPSLDSPPLETPPLAAQLPLASMATLSCSFSTAHLATDASFYFPTLPSFSAMDYLKVPPPSFHAPRQQEEDDKDIGMSNVTGKPFKLELSASSSSGSNLKGATIRERRQAAGLGAPSVGLGLGISPQHGDKDRLGATPPSRRSSSIMSIMDELEAEQAAWASFEATRRRPQEVAYTCIADELDAEEEAWFSFDDLSESSEDSESVDLSRLLDELEEEEAILLGQVRSGGLTMAFLPSISI